jgi:hypothetical protein
MIRAGRHHLEIVAKSFGMRGTEGDLDGLVADMRRNPILGLRYGSRYQASLTRDKALLRSAATRQGIDAGGVSRLMLDSLAPDIDGPGLARLMITSIQ